jgi:hypothetical protein
MRQHIRRDTIKVFAEDEAILQTIIADKKLSKTQGRAKAYRAALETYASLHQVPDSVAQLTKTIQELNEKVEQLYFIVQGSMK